MQDCPTCGLQTPTGQFCVRCGAPLHRQLGHARERGEFAAHPEERRYAPWLVSTLFPHLPKHSERHFHVALGVGAALVIVLGALRLFPVALITAAVLMPLLTILYFYDVDIYEAEPAWAAGWTLLWGAVTGVGVGLLAKAVAPTGAALIDRGSTAHVVTGGILLPALGVVLMLAGPLVLLRDRHFNETLDGAGFGAAAAATFAAGQAVVVGVDVLGGGLRPQGAVLPWIARLIAIAIATPVLSMSAIGAATAAVWLRYRAPAKDRGALGLFGSPAVAVLLAAVLVIAGAVGNTFMSPWVWLAWLAVLDPIALVLLRRALHVGLLEEAAQIEIGAPITCASCGASTATHSFCGNCGIALKALPKARRAAAETGAEHAGTRRGAFAGRFGGRRRGRRRLIVYAGLLTAAVAIAVVTASLAAPGAKAPLCQRAVQCGNPPLAPRAVFAFPGYTLWQSSALGYSLRYDSHNWQVANQNTNNVVLQAGDGFSVLAVTAAPASQASPANLVNGQLSSLRGQLLGFGSDSSAGDQLLGASVGLIQGIGGVYSGTIDSPQGPQAPASVAIMGATNGSLSIAVTMITPSDNHGDQHAVFNQADDIINSIQWSPS
jgi:hypothetical protein